MHNNIEQSISFSMVYLLRMCTGRYEFMEGNMKSKLNKFSLVNDEKCLHYCINDALSKSNAFSRKFDLWPNFVYHK